MLKFTLPSATKSSAIENLDRECPSCSSKKSHIHERKVRKVKDPRIDEIEQIRMKCCKCHHTWYVYPEGVKRNTSRTQHTLIVSVLLYCLGASHANVANLLQVITLRKLTSKSSSWRDFQKSGAFIKMKKLFSNGRRPRIVGLDGSYVRIKGKKVCVEIIVDEGTTVCIELANERREFELMTLFEELAKDLDLSDLCCIVCDDNPVHGTLIDNLNMQRGFSKSWIKQSLCLAHSKKTMSTKLNKFVKENANAPPGIIKQLESVIENDFPADQIESIRNLTLEADVTKNENLFSIVKNLYLRYEKYSNHNKLAGIPKTNNMSEHKFIRPKVRYRSTRGLKSTEGSLNFFRNLIVMNQVDIVQDVLVHI